MIKISLQEISTELNDGYAEVTIKDKEKKLTIDLPSLGVTGIKVYHDGRLYEKHLENFNLKPIIIDEIRINITGWFYIFYKLIIEVKEDHTYIAIIDK